MHKRSRLEQTIRTMLHENAVWRFAFRRYCRMLASLAGMGRPIGVAEGMKCRKLLIVCVAYGNAALISKQAERLKTMLTDDDYAYLVVDNSTRACHRAAIRDACSKSGAYYYAVPRRLQCLLLPKIFFYGICQGMALCWAYAHLVKPARPEALAIIDHDLFPMKHVSLLAYLGNKGLAGADRQRGKGIWYLWPGMCIFRMSVLEHCRPDFMPAMEGRTYLDTGGAMWRQLYRRGIRNSVNFIDCKALRIKHTEGLTTHDDILHSDCIHLLDDGKWLHIINSTNYAHLPGKEETIEEILNRI